MVRRHHTTGALFGALVAFATAVSPAAAAPPDGAGVAPPPPRPAVTGPVASPATGDPGPNPGVVGGVPTDRVEHPYYVQLTIGTAGCGASLIAPDWALTAAHCVDDGVTPRLGLRSVTVPAQEVRIHPLWNGDVTDGHDLALLRVDPRRTTDMTPIRVGAPFDFGAARVGDDAVVVGTGRPAPDQPAGFLNMATLVIRSDDHMSGIYEPWWNPFSDAWKDALMLGAGSDDRTVCFGDSGSLLYVERPYGRVQVGVPSFVRSDCGRPGGFAELDGPQLAWLATQVPSVADGWRQCAGTKVFTYGRGVGPRTDGPFRWDLRCRRPVPPPPPQEEPPICTINPRKCPDLP